MYIWGSANDPPHSSSCTSSCPIDASDPTGPKGGKCLGECCTTTGVCPTSSCHANKMARNEINCPNSAECLSKLPASKGAYCDVYAYNTECEGSLTGSATSCLGWVVCGLEPCPELAGHSCFTDGNSPENFKICEAPMTTDDPNGEDMCCDTSGAPLPCSTEAPTPAPVYIESQRPTRAPTTKSPTASPTTKSPTHSPTASPTTKSPTVAPTLSPTTLSPTPSPTPSAAASIGQLVWHDVNGNGMREGTEGVFSGVKLVLTDADGNTETQYTNANGLYLFDDLVKGTYSVDIDPSVGTIPSGYVRTAGNDPWTGLVILPFESLLSINFGYRDPGTASISGVVFDDEDFSATRETSETTRFPGVEISLKDADGNVVATTVSDSAGYYEFTGLVAGTYTVHVEDASAVTPGFSFTTANSGTRDIVLAIGGSDTEDFGYADPWTAKIQGKCWHDDDRDRVIDGTEAVIVGPTVNLLDGNGDPFIDADGNVATTTCGAELSLIHI